LIERITELLNQYNILNGKERLLPITTGAGGAYVFSVEDKYVVKYKYLPEVDFITHENSRKEFEFYKIFSNKNIDFIPEIVFQMANDEEILIVMKKYSPVKIEEWNHNLQKQAIEICARINAIDISGFSGVFQRSDKFKDEVAKIVGYTSNGTPLYKKDYPLSLSYQLWKNLQEKFPEHIDVSLLREMYENFDEMDSYAKTLAIPKTLCHGDWHPENCLKNGDKLLACDWEGVCIGKGIDSVMFFIYRGESMGININKNKLIEEYCGALLKYANIKVDLNDFHKHNAASSFRGSFSLGAKDIQNADIDSVLNSYNAMTHDYRLLLGH